MTFHPPGGLCLQTKYHRWYDAICANARGREAPTVYTEVHHIQPRSLGGSDGEVNLVRLTYREHFICHMLLVRMTMGLDRTRMLKALGAMGMKGTGERTPTGRQFDIAKKAVRDLELDDAAHDARYMNRLQKRQAEEAAEVAQLKIDEVEYWEKMFQFAKSSPELLADFRKRKIKRDNEIKSWGWHVPTDGPLRAKFHVVSFT